MINVGFVGYSATKFDKEEATKLVYKCFGQIGLMKNRLNEKVQIVSGATALGIPKIVYEVATSLDYRTVGVMCEAGRKEKLFPVNELIVKGQNWGDESETFIGMIDVLFRVGGGPQSMKEVEMAKAKGIPVVEYELERIEDKRK